VASITEIEGVPTDEYGRGDVDIIPESEESDLLHLPTVSRRILALSGEASANASR